MAKMKRCPICKRKVDARLFSKGVCLTCESQMLRALSPMRNDTVERSLKAMRSDPDFYRVTLPTYKP